MGYGLLKVLNDLQVDLEVFNASPVPPNALSKQQSLILKYQAEDLQRLQQFVESLLDRFLKSIAKVWQNVTQNIKTDEVSSIADKNASHALCSGPVHW